MQKISLFTLAILLSISLLGCGSGEALAPVAGSVLIDGKPFTTGKVIFNPIASEGEIEAGKPSFGNLDAEGKFTLSTYARNDGAKVGNHRVTIFHSGEDSIYEFTRLAVPGEDFSVGSESDNLFTIEITSEEVKKYGSSL